MRAGKGLICYEKSGTCLWRYLRQKVHEVANEVSLTHEQVPPQCLHRGSKIKTPTSIITSLSATFAGEQYSM